MATTAPPLRPTHCPNDASAIASIVVFSFCLALQTVLVALRFWARSKKPESMGWDDVFLVIAYMTSVPAMGLAFHMLAIGFGRPNACLTPTIAMHLARFEYIAEGIEVFSNMFSRISAAILVVRIFGVSKNIKWFVIWYTVFQAVVSIVTGILIYFQCSPIQGLWDHRVKATCWSATGRNSIDYVNGAVSAVADLIVAVVPAHYMRSLQVPLKFKIMVISLFAIALVPTASAIARSVLIDAQTTANTPRSRVLLGLFATLETTLLVSCATAPALPALFAKPRSPQTTGHRRIVSRSDPYSRDESKSTASSAAGNAKLYNMEDHEMHSGVSIPKSTTQFEQRVYEDA